MRMRESVRRETRTRRLTMALWIVAAYLVLLYVSVRWGDGMPPTNPLPSAD